MYEGCICSKLTLFTCLLVSELPGNLGEITSKVTELPSKLAQGVGEKCVLQ